MISKKIKENILSFLKTKNKGASASEIQRKLNYNRTTITKYLHILNSESQITHEVRGMAKIWTLSESPIITLLTKKNASDEKNNIQNIFNVFEDTGVRILDKDKKIIWMNKTLSSWIGDNSNKFVDMSCCSEYCQNNLENTLCHIKKTIETGKPTTFKTIMNTHTHKHIDVKINTYAIKDKNDSICGAIQLIENITEKQNIDTDNFIEQIDETSRMLSVLQNISYDATKSFKKEKFLQKVLNDVLYLLRISTGMIYLINKKTTRIELIISKGISKKFIDEYKKNSLRIGEGLVGKIAKTGEIIHLKENASNDSRIIRLIAKKEKLQSFIGLPLKTRDSIRGVLVFAHKDQHNFTHCELDMLYTISNQVASALENAALFKKTKESKNLYKSLMDASPDAVVLIDLDLK
ncbi:GAF domain-containing protein, partial [archaeon]|nr:GAF domain-containing protein [archaeon]